MAHNRQPNLPDLLNYALVAPRTKVLYVPVTKVACSTLKLFLAQVEGSWSEDATRRVISANVSQEQTIHNYLVHGLQRFHALPRRRQWEIIDSPDWMRIAALRDPLRRAYSSWENRVLLRAPGTDPDLLARCPDVLVDGRLDVPATFARFASALRADPELFMRDDHFRPQFNTLYVDQVDYDVVARLDQHGDLQRLADAVNRRAGTTVALQRLNSGIGIGPDQVYDAATARTIEDVYERDYAWFGFERHDHPAAVPALVLDPLQQSLLRDLRAATERISALSTAAFGRVGFRYGAGQMLKSAWWRLSPRRRRLDPRLAQW
jgi:hypothetical protein